MYMEYDANIATMLYLVIELSVLKSSRVYLTFR